MSAELESVDIPYVKINDITSTAKYSCVGGPFGSSLSRKHYIDEEAVPVIRGTNLNSDQFIDDGFVFVSEEKGDELHRNLAYPGDIVFTQRGTLGQVAIIPKDVKYKRYVVSQSQMKLTVNQEVADPYYVYSYFRSPEAKRVIHNNAIIGGVPHINLGILKAIEIPLPSLKIQKQISEIVKSLDDKIELNRQTNQTLEHIAQAIFKSWFVDFEPTRAKIAAKQIAQARQDSERSAALNTALFADGRWPEAVAAAIAEGDPERAAMAAISGKSLGEIDQLSPEQKEQLLATAALFPDALVDSELGEIPEGWELQKLEDVLELAYGKALKKTDRIEGEFPVYGSGGITGSHDKALIAGPGIIVGRKGTVGALYWEDSSFFPIDTVFYVKPKNNTTLVYAYYLLQTLGLEDMNTDAAVPGLNRNNAYRLEIVKPPKILALRFSEIIRVVRNKLFINKEESSTLEMIRDSLLPKLLSGEIKIGEVA